MLTWPRIAWLISEASSLSSHPQKGLCLLTLSASVQGKIKATVSRDVTHTANAATLIPETRAFVNLRGGFYQTW